ncbi:hypothetical protein [Pseudomonas resinovorans]|uniref:hypothetical protein n=1 Tax=Pseudomonadaceae TaxID=135621 RepID=UPI00041AD421
MHDDFGLHCLHAVSRVVPASCFAFYRVDPQLRARDFQLLRMDARPHRDYLDHYRDFDPLQPALCQDERRVVELLTCSASTACPTRTSLASSTSAWVRTRSPTRWRGVP